MDISWGLKQDIVWIPAKRDENGDPITSPSGAPEYLAPVTIKGRFRYKTRQTVTRQGAEITGRSHCICKERVQPGDLLVHDGREWPVIDAESAVGLGDSKESFWKVFM